jgi:hypothetical protein
MMKILGMGWHFNSAIPGLIFDFLAIGTIMIPFCLQKAIDKSLAYYYCVLNVKSSFSVLLWFPVSNFRKDPEKSILTN